MSSDRPDRVICVLGMHRSGTSALTGSLEQHGLFLGERNVSSPHNPRGNRESKEIRRLHEAILESSGGTWQSPPERVQWSPDHTDWARRILANYSGRPTWGFKDPRSLLTMDGWREVVPDLEHVGIFRHPLRVAQSLSRRDHLEPEVGIALWRHYNERLLAAHRRGAFPILSFDDEEAELREKLSQVAATLGLDAESSDDPFFSAELRRVEPVSGGLPEPVRVLFEELRELAL